MSYQDLLASKSWSAKPTGFDATISRSMALFPHQKALSEWALRMGRAAIFADTGLGKSRMQLAWAEAIRKHADVSILILAPLAVASQTVHEGQDIGVSVKLCREDSDVVEGINITNYDRLHKFDHSRFGAVVLDESSIIKHHDSKTLKTLLDAFRKTQYKLCATATPAPNDWVELGTHAEFLGICTRTEMLAEFFCHDGGETQVWRLKGHARKAFWRWVSSWAALVRRPSDLGFDDTGYILPRLSVEEHKVSADESTVAGAGMLFPLEASTLMERRDARRASTAGRVKACADMVNSTSGPWVVWCELNVESEQLTDSIDGAIEVRGSSTPEDKESAMIGFAEGRHRVIVTKPKIAGFGLNWQHCANVAFVGVSDSFESYYQAVRRCWRFGQTRPVNVHLFVSELEGSVLRNLRRKEEEARLMSDALSDETSEMVRKSVIGSKRTVNIYEAKQTMNLPAWIEEEVWIA